MLVIGASNSSNSQRLVEVAEREGNPAGWWPAVGRGRGLARRRHTLGITAGASAPEALVREVVDRLAEHFDVREEPVEGVEEHMVFKLPAGLQAA